MWLAVTLMHVFVKEYKICLSALKTGYSSCSLRINITGSVIATLALHTHAEKDVKTFIMLKYMPEQCQKN